MTLSGIPLPPSANNIYATVGRKRIKSRELRKWETDLTAYAYENLQTVNSVRRILEQELMSNQVLQIEALYYFKPSRILCKSGEPKRLDTSNYLKALHDGLANVLGIDDKYFWDGTFKKFAATGPEHVTVTFKVRAI